MNKLKKLSQITFSILFWIGVWALASYRMNNSFLIPSPKSVIVSTWELLKTAEFWLIISQSLLRILLGIIIAVIIGILLAVITSKVSFINILVTPLMSAVKATPVASFIFIAIIFMNRNSLPVFITSLLVLPIIWTNVSAGINGVPKELKEVSEVYKFSYAKKLSKLYIPSVLPYFLAACRSALGLAWKAGVAAEVLCTPKSAIGTELYFSKTYLDTVLLFAWTLITVILSLIIEKSIIYLLSKLPYKNVSSETEVRA